MRRFLLFFIGAPGGAASRLLPVLLWAAGIFVLSSIPGYRYPRIDIPDVDKGVHAVIFLPLGFLLARSLPTRGVSRANTFKRNSFAFLVGTLYGLSDEIHQLWVPFRQFSWMDWAVDSFAVMLGVLLWAWWRRRLTRGTRFFHVAGKTA